MFGLIVQLGNCGLGFLWSVSKISFSEQFFTEKLNDVKWSLTEFFSNVLGTKLFFWKRGLFGSVQFFFLGKLSGFCKLFPALFKFCRLCYSNRYI